MTDDDDEWTEVWNTRIKALEVVLGPCHDEVFHAPHPFELGGFADVVAFHQHIPGIVYVTSELTGKPDSLFADYELMVCHRDRDEWGPNVMSRLAPYTQQSRIRAGETMDIDSATPADSKIKAFIFDTYATISMFGECYDLRLCLGITKSELQYKIEHGSEVLLSLLKQHGVYPYTDLSRDSIPLGS